MTHYTVWAPWTNYKHGKQYTNYSTKVQPYVKLFFLLHTCTNGTWTHTILYEMVEMRAYSLLKLFSQLVESLDLWLETVHVTDECTIV